jgi:hypothetical protein
MKRSTPWFSVPYRLVRCPLVQCHQHQDEEGEAKGERHDDKHRCHDRGIIGLPCHQEAEDGAGAGGQDQPPDKRGHACSFGEIIHLAFHHHPQVHADHGHEAGVEHDVPGKDGLEVIVGHRHDQAIRATQVQYQYRQSADQQGNGEQA